MKQIFKFVHKYTSIYFAFILLISGLLVYRLGNLPSGYSNYEQALIKHPQGLSSIFTNSVNLPLKILEFCCYGAWGTHSLWLLRLPSVLLSVVAIYLFFYLLNRWYGARTASLGIIIFISSAWFLHIARTPVIDIEQVVGILSLLFMMTSLKTKHSWFYHMITAFWLGVILFIPGLIYYEIVFILLNLNSLTPVFKSLKMSWQKVLYILSWLIPVALIIVDISLKPNIYKQFLGMQGSTFNWHHFLNNLVTCIFDIFWRAQSSPSIWLDRLAYLNVFVILIFLVGCIFYIRHPKAARTEVLYLYLIMGFVLFGVHSSITLSSILIMIFLIASAGLGYLIHEWLVVFPRNPLARAVGILVVSCVVLLSALYGLRQYFVAWPDNAQTQQVFEPYARIGTIR